MKYSQLVSMPSAVSDWLEEQLEARGIDSLVYTRYVLSLLHSHTLDIICPDGQDLYSVYLKKEVKRAGGRNKRFCRSSSDWWKHAQADAEQIKRSAAVECLMSASDQNCEIESLVDELCEKLKSKDNDSIKTVEETSTVPLVVDNPHQKITPQELAEKYYAAFPPLRTHYICGKNQQEKSKFLQLMEPKWNVGGSPGRKRGFAGKIASSEEKSHTRVETESIKPRSLQQKQRFPYFSRMKNSACRKLDWEQPAFKKSRSKSKSAFEEHRRSLPKVDFSGNNNPLFDDFDQCLDVDKYKNTAAWSDATENDHDIQMYDDLPVDLSELLESPTPPPDDMVEMMNMANMTNMRDDGKRQYIPYGTNIISSIWSTDRDECSDNSFNAALDLPGPVESSLNIKFKSISINSNDAGVGVVNASKLSAPWNSFSPIAENDTNSFFESRYSENYANNLFEGFHSLPGGWRHIRREDNENGIDPDSMEYQNLLRMHNESLKKLNHNRGRSGFAEVLPKTMPKAKSYNPFTRQTSFFAFSNRPNISLDREKEDLLTSERTHFKPIVEEIDKKVKGQYYADGATFVISNNLDKIDYKRSESGTMILENDFGPSKKYFEYKIKDSPPTPPDKEFVLKVHICQNDKACQTDVGDSNTTVPIITGLMENLFDSNITSVMEASSPAPSSGPSFYIEEELNNCTCPVESLFSGNMNVSNCPVHVRARPESILGEVVWNYENRRCEKCNSNKSGTVTGSRDEWCRRGLKDIWSGGEICQTCLNLNSCPTPSSSIHSKLREDISQDGEQLLSDLKNLQKAYMEELPTNEVSCNILELVNAAAINGNNELKRRHSIIVASGDNLCVGAPWSFASRLEEDCLIQMSTLPTLRSVTF